MSEGVHQAAVQQAQLGRQRWRACHPMQITPMHELLHTCVCEGEVGRFLWKKATSSVLTQTCCQTPHLAFAVTSFLYLVHQSGLGSRLSLRSILQGRSGLTSATGGYRSRNHSIWSFPAPWFEVSRHGAPCNGTTYPHMTAGRPVKGEIHCQRQLQVALEQVLTAWHAPHAGSHLVG